MVTNPPTDMPRVTPYLLYEDAGAAIEFITRAFGFTEDKQNRQRHEDGKVRHAELRLGDGLVLLGSPVEEYKNPRRINAITQFLYIYVEDLDVHLQRARDAGAEIITEPEDTAYGDRRYAAVDPEGHQWWFAVRVR